MLIAPASVSCRNGIPFSFNFPQLEILFFYFRCLSMFFHVFAHGYKLTLISFSVYIILYCFYPRTYILNVKTSTCKSVNIFSIAVHVFCNMFWKICPLFRQILITCLKCSRASFSPFSYSKKMRWDEVAFCRVGN